MNGRSERANPFLTVPDLDSLPFIRFLFSTGAEIVIAGSWLRRLEGMSATDHLGELMARGIIEPDWPDFDAGAGLMLTFNVGDTGGLSELASTGFRLPLEDAAHSRAEWAHA